MKHHIYFSSKVTRKRSTWGPGMKQNLSLDPKVSIIVLGGAPGSYNDPPRCHNGGAMLAKVQLVNTFGHSN